MRERLTPVLLRDVRKGQKLVMFSEGRTYRGTADDDARRYEDNTGGGWGLDLVQADGKRVQLAQRHPKFHSFYLWTVEEVPEE